MSASPSMSAGQDGYVPKGMPPLWRFREFIQSADHFKDNCFHYLGVYARPVLDQTPDKIDCGGALSIIAFFVRFG